MSDLTIHVLADAVYDISGPTGACGLTMIGPRFGGLLSESDRANLDAAQVLDFRGSVLLPGFVNAHSHAFQRALRGRTEAHEPSRPEDDFWSWRKEMYGLAQHLSRDGVAAVTRWAFADMVRAGFTSVGEFHYLHRMDSEGAEQMAATIIDAASDVGIGLCLIHTAYFRAGHQKSLVDAQRSFVFPSADAFCVHVAKMMKLHPDVNHAVALHSVRAVSEPDIKRIADFAKAQDLPLHVHVAEQRGELEECEAEYGLTPVGLLDRAGALTQKTVLVHATHIDDNDVALIVQSGAQVCICPSTERNLGDGLCPIVDLFDAAVPISIGTDSHARIDPFDEARSLEEHERLRRERRLVLRKKDSPGLYPAVIPSLTTNGDLALGMPQVRFDMQSPATFVAVRTPIDFHLNQPSAAADALLMSASSSEVRHVFRNGEQLIKNGRSTRVDEGALLKTLRMHLRE